MSSFVEAHSSSQAQASWSDDSTESFLTTDTVLTTPTIKPNGPARFLGKIARLDVGKVVDKSIGTPSDHNSAFSYLPDVGVKVALFQSQGQQTEIISPLLTSQISPKMAPLPPLSKLDDAKPTFRGISEWQLHAQEFGARAREDSVSPFSSTDSEASALTGLGQVFVEGDSGGHLREWELRCPYCTVTRDEDLTAFHQHMAMCARTSGKVVAQRQQQKQQQRAVDILAEQASTFSLHQRVSMMYAVRRLSAWAASWTERVSLPVSMPSPVPEDTDTISVLFSGPTPSSRKRPVTRKRKKPASSAQSMVAPVAGLPRTPIVNKRQKVLAAQDPSSSSAPNQSAFVFQALTAPQQQQQQHSSRHNTRQRAH